MTATSARGAVAYQRITAQPVGADAHEHMVTMRDGVRLATDVYLPQPGCGPGPTILIRLPYDKNGAYTYIPDIAAYMVRRGYRVVAQDVRGKFRSEGETILWINEAYDGFDTLEWIVAQPWSDEIVGMWGDSYYGFTQLAAASTAHPALKAIVPRVTGTRLGDLPRRAGRVSEVETGVGRIYPVTHFQANDTFEWEMDWSRRPFAAVVEEWFATIGERSASYDLMTPHPVTLRRFPAGHPFDAHPVAMLQTIGWFDNCAPWQWQDHALIAARPEWAAREYLLLEDIDHENNRFREHPIPERDDPVINQEFRTAVLPSYLDPALEFFDVFLRGEGTPGDIARVRWRVAGEPGYRVSDRWPPPEARAHTLHLAGEELRDRGEPRGRPLEWVHDACDLVPSPVANPFAFLREYPDERALAVRDDVLSFDGAPLTEPLVLAGPVALTATIASTGSEMDLFARLVDVAPDGAAHLIARGELTLYGAQEPAAVTVEMGHAGYRVAIGHGLRLTLASSDFPQFVPAPGTGEHRWLASDRTTNRQSVVIGGPRGATLTLTILP